MAAKKKTQTRAVSIAVPAPASGPAPSRATEDAVAFADSKAWNRWLAKEHGTSRGVWLVLAKAHARTTSGAGSITYAQAVDVALAWGWIDSHKKGRDEDTWVQRFTPRGARSIWSKINRDKALALIASCAMQPAGLAEVERAKKDGRWERAYDSPRTSAIPEDLAAALAANARAAAFFAQLNAQNRYAILFRIQTVKKAETRASRIATFISMLARKECLHP